MKVAVLGAGAMGTGIGQVAAQNSCQVVYYDSFPGAIDRSKSSIEKIFSRLVEKGRISDDERASTLALMKWSKDISAIKGADLVIEAVIENLEVKKALYAEVEALIAEDSWLCTNTSSLSIAALSSELKHPQRFGGLHFFNPAPLMPLVEIVPGIQSNDDFADTMEALMASWGKVPVLAKDTPGFIVNKVARPFYSEAIKLYEEGVASVAEIDAAVKSSLRDTTTRILSSLTPREERVLRMRFGIGMNTDHTLEEVGLQFSVTRERIRQIEAKALRKLKHPRRSKQLKSFLEK